MRKDTRTYQDRRDYRLARNHHIRAVVSRYKQLKGCYVCGEKEPACLDFHAPNGHTDASISFLVRQSAALSRIQEEIRECVVLCSNCHRKLHAGVLDVPQLPHPSYL